MFPFSPGFFTCLTTFFRSRYNLSLEIIALRQQLGVLKRQNPSPRLQIHDRIFWILLRRFWSAWSNVLVIVKPETVVAWHRAGFRLFWRIRSRANKGRPQTDAELRRLIKRMAFLKTHWDVLAAIDFTTIEVWTKGGLVTFYLLFVLELATRRVQLAGCTSDPTEAWMMQVGRNLTDPLDGFLRYKRYLLMDRDSKHCATFRELGEQSGPHCVRLPPRSPNLSAHLERFIRSIKEECFDRMILFGDRSLRNAAQEYISHYHAERNHQGLGNRIIEPGDEIGCTTGEIACRERLGGTLRYYHRRAA